MTFHDLYYIAVIAEEKSITKAAKKLYMSQPALSQYLKKVERELGILVFERTTVGVKPTDEGQVFIEFAQRALQDEQLMRQQIKIHQNKDEGEIRLGFTGAQATMVLPYILPDFYHKYPKINTILIEESSDRIEEMLTNRELDAAFIHPPVLSSDLKYFEFSRDDLVVVPRLNSDYEKYVYWSASDQQDSRPYIRLEYLKGEPLALTQPSMRSRMVCDQIFEKAGIAPFVKLVSKRLSTLEGLARVGLISTILPYKQLSEELKQQGCAFYIEPAYNIPYAFALAVRKNTHISHVVQCLIDEVQLKKYTF